MAFDPVVLAQARELVVAAGMGDFRPPAGAPDGTHGDPVAIALINCFSRAQGVPNFDKPDVERPGVVRSASILLALRAGTPLPPLMLFHREGDARYELVDGFHRLHLCAALGFTHMPAVLTDWKPGLY
ncbi:hypothetical protein [Variovorax saccharolyticus]|uniref:hypothetical protein n=1 Tax=Variovorax saccharolyticus TaxID=3053516 RepID=UPI00257899C3|nr:hypothetical protein [Variovorax sp. J31P216]MDM0029898.1 hypothetical protein [Variovorax sp. J31P216]